jgi:hypothetical protein
VVTPDIRGILTTDDGAKAYYEIRGYGIDVAGFRHFRGSMYFLSGDERYTWLNTVMAVMEGRYVAHPEGLFIGTFQVYECVAETESIEVTGKYHEDIAPPKPVGSRA